MKRRTYYGWLALLAIYAAQGAAQTTVALVDFELNDLTSLPNTLTEQQRTASIRPLLEQALQQQGLTILHVDQALVQQANAGFGYLFNHDDAAEQLGQQLGAHWIVIGQHSKPSFLFSYLNVHLIEVGTPHRQQTLAIEMKGNHRRVTEHGVQRLARQIQAIIHR